MSLARMIKWLRSHHLFFSGNPDQAKSLKPLRTLDPREIKDALEELGYSIKSVVNIFNKQKIPQPMFKVELEPDNRKLKKMKLILFIRSNI